MNINTRKMSLHHTLTAPSLRSLRGSGGESRRAPLQLQQQRRIFYFDERVDVLQPRLRCDRKRCILSML